MMPLPEEEPRIVVATLLKHASDDGMWHIQDPVGCPIGKRYLVDLNTIKSGAFLNTVQNKSFACAIIVVVDSEGKALSFMPVELLKIDGLEDFLKEQRL